jgi:hypothetical protein
MSYREDIPIDLLVMDTINPRLPEVQKSQRDAVRTMARTLGGKLVGLAEHIVNRGISLGDLPIVMEAEDDPQSFTVLDGNRRLAAIRSLEHPEIVQGVLAAGQLKKLKKLALEYRERPIGTLLCVVMANRKEADPWIQLRHRGQGGGAGLAPWNGIQGARYDDRVGERRPELNVFNFVREQGELTDDLVKKLDTFPISTLERLINDRDLRSRIGIELARGVIRTRYPAEEIIKPLRKIVTDLAEGKVTVSDLKRKDQRLQYAAGFTEADLPNPKRAGTWKPLEELPPIVTGKGGGKPAGKGKGGGSERERDTLVPSTLHLKFPIPRIEKVFGELKKLNVDMHLNIAGVMLRVFFEWTTEHYIDANGLRAGLSHDQKLSLHKRVIVVLDHLEKSAKMTKHELKAIRVEVNNKHSLLAMDTLHAYVHNVGMVLKSSELRQTWDRMAPLMQKIWS